MLHVDVSRRKTTTGDETPKDGAVCSVGIAANMHSSQHLYLVYCYKIVFDLVKLNFSDYLDFSVAPTRGLCTNCINIDVTASELAFPQAELLTCGTVYLSLSYLPACLPLNGLFNQFLKRPILTSKFV